ncbi:hypothetical protein MHBO_003060 [Bonamia ostreae]|uniref:ATP-dependent RNA helicase Ski2/MTR4 C-terminal domain-containing protein n=1 Tax=Bonamia ostreae TaxID=126728 RepID=A0ABV2APS2_9EUKA
MIKHHEKTISNIIAGVNKKLEKRRKKLISFFLKNLVLTEKEMSIVAEEAFYVTEQLAKFDFHGNFPFLDQFYKSAKDKIEIKKEMSDLDYLLSDESVPLIEDFERKTKILKELNFIGEDRSVLIKGRVACEINNCDSLILSEMIFENVLSDLEPENILSLISCLVFKQKNCSEPHLSRTQENSLEALIAIAQRIGMLQDIYKVGEGPQKYVEDSINPNLMEVVYQWAKGKDFSEICRITNVHEGVIVRTIVRIDETCRDLKSSFVNL